MLVTIFDSNRRKSFPDLKMVAEVDQREVALQRKAEVQEQHRKSDLFFAPFDPRFPNQNQTRLSLTLGQRNGGQPVKVWRLFD